jgi:hypothetical protein
MQQLPNSSTSYMDGIALMETRIQSMESYRALKLVIGDGLAKGITITSLSFLDREK